jgi:hypothetical protein
MTKELNGNVYVRAAATSPLVSWSPAQTEGCISRLGSLDEFRKAMPSFEASGSQLALTPRTAFKGPDLDRYELRQPLPLAQGWEMSPADVRKLLGWSDQDAKTAGAYPVRR